MENDLSLHALSPVYMIFVSFSFYHYFCSNLMNEIIQTEIQYVADLEHICKVSHLYPFLHVVVVCQRTEMARRITYPWYCLTCKGMRGLRNIVRTARLCQRGGLFLTVTCPFIEQGLWSRCSISVKEGVVTDVDLSVGV